MYEVTQHGQHRHCGLKEERDEKKVCGSEKKGWGCFLSVERARGVRGHATRAAGPTVLRGQRQQRRGLEKKDWSRNAGESKKKGWGSEKKACGSEKKGCGSEKKGCGSEKKGCGSEKKGCGLEKKDCGGQKRRFVGQKRRVVGQKKRGGQKKRVRGSKKREPSLKFYQDGWTDQGNLASRNGSTSAVHPRT